MPSVPSPLRTLSRGARRALSALALAALTFLAMPAAAGGADLIGPLRFADTDAGLVVGDYVGNQVLVVDRASLQVTSDLRIWSDEAAQQPGKPLSVGWMNGLLYVGEERSGNIQVFRWGVYHSGRKQKPHEGWIQVRSSLTAAPIAQPSAIAGDDVAGLLFIASKAERCVLVVDAAGNVLRRIGSTDSAAPLGNPQGIALDSAGRRVFVTDDSFVKSGMLGSAMYSTVQVYDYDGRALGKIDGSTGMGNAAFRFARAQGVARDAAGRVYVADSYRHEVLVFAESATTPNAFSAFTKLGTKGIAAGELLMPTGVFVDAASGKVYVANTMLQRIEVFGALGATP